MGRALFAGIKLVYQVGHIGDVHIRIVVSVIDTPAASADLGAGGYMDMEYQLSVIEKLLHREVQRREQFLWIIDGGHKVFLNFVRTGRVHAEYGAVVRHTEKNVPTVTVGKKEGQTIPGSSWRKTSLICVSMIGTALRTL